MATTEKTPLWLELKKEYIDDNFAALRNYLENSKNRDDAFYQTTIELFRERISDLLVAISERSLYADDEDRQQVSSNVQMLATYLLADADHDLALPAYVAFMNGLRIMTPRMSDAITKTIFLRLRHERIASLGFSWKDLEKIGTEIFAHNACKQSKFETPLSKPMIYSNWGTAILTDRGLMLTYDTKETTRKLVKEGADSLDTGLGITLRTAPGDKLKQSLSNSVKDMDEYAKEFIYKQAFVKNKKKTEVPRLKNYSEGDEVIVRVTAVRHEARVETVDPAYNKLYGVIRFERQSIIYYYADELYKYFHVGDYLTATVKDLNNGYFSIESQLIKFFVDFAYEVVTEDSDTVSAKLIDEKDNYSEWLTDFGVAVRVDGPSDYRRGDYADITIKEFGKGKYYGLIRGYVHGEARQRFDEKAVRHDCIRQFAEYTEAPAFQRHEEETKQLSPVLLRLLLRLLFEYQSSLLKPSDRIRCLANANVLAEMVGDNLAASYISFVRTYLRALIQFVNGEDLHAIELEPDEEYKDAKSTLIRLGIIDLLKEYGRKDNSEKLAKTISDFEKDLPQLARLARLIQTANSMLDILSGSARNVIHREIIRTLSLETESDTDLEADHGNFLGVESGTQEFKTSFVYPPDKHMQPDEYTQKGNIMKGICAFLNSDTGGTLYLGVNDQGYVVGIDNDLKYLKMKSIDAYMRYVQDTAMKYFGIDALPYLRIEPLYEGKVVAIHVEPHPYRVVELDGTAYLRINAESRIMPEQLRLQMIGRKMFTNKDRAAAISLLQQAYSQKRCVILHNYASNNSGAVSNRLIEPYDVRPEDNLVVCYDINKEGTRVFNLSRIGYVEILADKPWTNSSKHKAAYVDVFHMSDDVARIPISLELDLMAKNLLVEEYPRAKEFITGQKGDENTWYFTTDVCRLEGIGRFYIGLANHIKILKGDELRQYARDYAEKYL